MTAGVSRGWLQRWIAPYRREGWRATALLVTMLALLGVFLLYPIWLTVRGAFVGVDGTLTLFHFVQVFTDPVLREGLVNALGIAIATTCISVLIALPLAVLTGRFRFPGKKWLTPALLAPLILPPFVGAIGIVHLLGRSGSINTLLIDLGLRESGIDFIGQGGFWAIVLVEALHLYPIVYLNTVASLNRLDPALEESARSLGAGWWRRFFSVLLPQIRPGIYAGATIVFVWSLTELGTPLVFDYPKVTPVQIFFGLREMNVSSRPYALTAVLLIAAGSAFAVGHLLAGGRVWTGSTRATREPATQPLPRWGRVAVVAFFGLVIVFAVAPHVGVILASVAETGQWYESVLPTSLTLGHYEEAMHHPLAVGSIRNSLLYASVAVLIDLGLALVIGWLVVRTLLPGRRLLDMLSMLPLAVPGLVMAFGYVAMTLRWPFGEGDILEGVADVLGAEPNPVPLLIIAYAVRRLPYVVRSVVAGLEQTPIELEEAALNLGASRLRIMRSVLVPLLTANLLAGGLLAFSFAMLEVSDSLILAQRSEHFPITKAIFVLFERLGEGQAIAAALGVWAMVLLALTLLCAARMLGKRTGALFEG